MDDFIDQIARIYSRVQDTAKGTYDNMMRVPRGEADQEMLEHTRKRNDNLLRQARPRGSQSYKEMYDDIDPETRRKLYGNPYRNAFQSLFD